MQPQNMEELECATAINPPDTRRRPWSRPLARWLTLTATAFVLCSCVASETPLLVGSEAVVGKQFDAQLFRAFSDGKASELRKTVFHWQDTNYVNDGSGAVDFARFSTQRLDGDDSIIQTSDASGKLYRYWIGRKLMAGVFLIFPIDESNVDAATKDAACAKEPPLGLCLVRSPEQLFALARATAAKPVKNGELAVVVEKGLVAMSDAEYLSRESRAPVR